MKRQLIFIILSLVALAGQSQFNFDLVNSVYDEQCPVITPDGATLFFTRANHAENIGGVADKGDIWYSTMTSDTWSTPVHAGSNINNDQWNGVLGLSNNGNTMILHHHYLDDKQGLSISENVNGTWSKPKVLEIPYFINRSQLQSGSISNDGNTILLSIESYNTKGGEDIYVLLKQANGSWSDPKNLGNVINTKFQELTPYLASDKRTLFFASNGHPNSAGSFDIYKSLRQDDTWSSWSEPINLSSSINSEGRESSYQYLEDSKTAVYVSTLDSDGYGDIRSIIEEEQIQEVIAAAEDTLAISEANVPKDTTLEVLPKDPYFKGSITEVNSGKLLDGSILLTALPGGVQTYHEVKNGLFNVPISIGDYHLGVEAKGYLGKFLTVKVDSMVTQYHIALSPIVVGERVNLKSVLFGRGTDELLPSSYDELDAVVHMMTENPQMEILLGGHTDSQGSSKLNYSLSQRRVEAVKKYLQSKGIAGRRIEGKGYGSSRPIASNKNEETRKLNRRVEFTVIKN